MTIDEFLRKLASEPEKTVTRAVQTLPADALGEASRGGLRLSDLLGRKGSSDARSVRYRHLVGPGISPTKLVEWQSRWPSHPLPADMKLLLQRIDGIHLWANADTGRAYTGVAPIKEWGLAREKLNARPSTLDDRYLGISYHQDGAALVALDVQSGAYYLMDAAGPDTSTQLGRSIEELLDWLWRTRIEPRP
jgi:hypothetical protein